ncbi:MAG TPA: CotH kinase family protein [Vicinamibacterales bacterium]|nr:CotH kinase family protein [Vicinamibacterales bacterium]
MKTSQLFRWIVAVVGAGAGLSLALYAQPGFGFGPDRQEIKLVKQFDKNGDGRLDAAERKSARSTAASQSRGGWFRGGGGFAEVQPGRRLTPSDVRSYPASTPLYDLGTLRTIFLQFESNDWEQELADFHNTDVEVPATMTVDGQKFADVGVHFRGNSSYSMTPAGYKRSLNLSLDFVHEKQALGGYRTLNLLNAFNDATFVRAVLYSEIARQYVPTPRMNYVRVVINGESWGIYLNAQQYNKDFTRDYFGTTDGARWKTPGNPRGMAGLEYLGESADAYKSIYEIKSKDTPKSWAELIRLTRILNQTPLDKLESSLAAILDVDGALKFLAVEIALENSDGYWARASDYSIFQDPKGIFHILPYDVNEAMGGEGGRGGFGFGRGEPDPLVGLNDPSKPLRSRLLAVPALRARYMATLRDIAEKHLDWAVQGPRIKQWQALIAEDVKADTRKLYSSGFESDVASLQAFLTRRRATLLR